MFRSCIVPRPPFHGSQQSQRSLTPGDLRNARGDPISSLIGRRADGRPVVCWHSSAAGYGLDCPNHHPPPAAAAAAAAVAVVAATSFSRRPQPVGVAKPTGVGGRFAAPLCRFFLSFCCLSRRCGRRGTVDCVGVVLVAFL